jgi:3,4-dihydroxy 2-butanone 4-phosphate synthase/GTP cyclohydrolase II
MTTIPVPGYDLTAMCFPSREGKEHLVLASQHWGSVPLVRVHSECVTGDVFGSLRCDCGAQLHAALGMICAEGGLLLYLRQEGRGIGLAGKLQAYELQDDGLDTVDANLALGFRDDERSYDDAISILWTLAIPRIRLITNNPRKVRALSQGGIEIVEVVPCIMAPTQQNLRYMTAKKERMEHQI